MEEVDEACIIVNAEMTLALPDTNIDLTGKMLHLYHTYYCSSSMLKEHDFKAYTQFYDDMQPVHEPFEQKCQPHAEEKAPVLDVPFFSGHWMAMLNKYANVLKQAVDGASGSLRELDYLRNPRLNKAKAHIDAGMRRMSAIQKVFHRGLNAQGQQSETVVMVIYWKFRLTRSPEELGTTSFRNFIRPVPRTVPDYWSSSELPIGHAKREESSFAIKDETMSFDSSFALPLSYEMMELPAYSFNDATQSASLDFPSYASADYQHSYDTQIYGHGMMTELPTPTDGSGSDEDGSDMADLTQITDADMTMFEYAGMHGGLDEQVPHRQLLGPGDGLALGIGMAEHLQAYDPTLLSTTAAGLHHDRDQHEELANVVHHPAGFAPHSFPPFPALSATTSQMEHALATGQDVDNEPTRFHHYHRVPRLQHPHHDQHGTPEIHTPIHEELPIGPGLILATPWFPHHDQENHHLNTHHNQDLLLPHPPRLYRHDTDTTISVEDVEEFERLASQEVVYSHAQVPELFELDADDKTIIGHDMSQDAEDVLKRNIENSVHARHTEHNLHDLAAVAAASFDDADWEMLPAPPDSAVAVSFKGDHVSIHTLATAAAEHDADWEML